MKETLDKMFDGSLANINIGNSLDLVEAKDRAVTLANICKKVAIGGTLELSGTDLGDLSRAVYHGYVSTQEANSLLFTDGGSSVSRIEEVVAELAQLGFKVINKRRNKYVYYIKAERCNA